jgi:DNA-binding response OmpR family regulator
MGPSSLRATIGEAMMLPMPPRDQAPILVVDDDPKIVTLVRMYLERERYPVITAGDGAAALRAIDEAQPRLVVLDLMLPEVDGLTVIRRARARGDVPILVLSARGAVGDRIVGLAEGADDYLPKPFSPAELVARVRTILRRTERDRDAVRGERLAIADLELDPNRYTATVAGQPIELSALEVRLLWALLDANGRVLSRDALLDAIHGDGEGDISDRAIDQYVKRLREKLGDDPAAPRYVATVRGVGYRAAAAVTRSETPG